MTLLSFAPIALLAVLAAGAAAAQNVAPAGISQTTTGELQTRRAGGGPVRFDLSPANHVVSGDELVYTVEIRNTTPHPIEGVVAVSPIPEKMTYLAGSASGPGCDIEFSVDGGGSFAAAKDLTIKLPAGQSRPAVAADYTHIRWKLKFALSGRATAYARFRAVLK
ncbi:MAG: DUF11 domain-containing protein [Proteobacteria bacterium]|nr:DUF11 domain-containing protein [Pseudomonadota bacterium]